MQDKNDDVSSKNNLATTTTPDFEPLYWESDRYNQREHCRECGSTNTYTRIYFHETRVIARWLCYCCALDIQATEDGRFWKELTVTPTLKKED